MDHIQAIELGLGAKAPYNEIARKIFLTYPTAAFLGEEERQYEVFNEISSFLGVSISSIHVCGSAKIGKSVHKKTDFEKGKSDLDVAIVDAGLFTRYLNIGLAETNSYSDRAKFPRRNGASTFDEYSSYLARGIFRPDLMPICAQRANWRDFFSLLSDRHLCLFGSISAAVYVSELCFEYKQRSVIRNYASTRTL